MKKGFTLVELLFVMAISAALFGFALVNFLKFSNNQLKAQTEMKTRDILLLGKELLRNSDISEDDFMNGWKTTGYVSGENKQYIVHLGGEDIPLALPSEDTQISLNTSYDAHGNPCFSVNLKNSSIPSPFISFGKHSCKHLGAPMYLDY